MGIVLCPIGTLRMEVSTQECVEALWRLEHVVVRLWASAVRYVVLARWIKRGKECPYFCAEDVSGCGGSRIVGHVEGKWGRPTEGRGHHDYGLEYVGANERAQGCDARTMIVPNHRSDSAATKDVHECDSIPHNIEPAVGTHVVVVVDRSLRDQARASSSITTLVGSNNVVSQMCNW